MPSFSPLRRFESHPLRHLSRLLHNIPVFLHVGVLATQPSDIHVKKRLASAPTMLTQVVADWSFPALMAEITWLETCRIFKRNRAVTAVHLYRVSVPHA